MLNQLQARGIILENLALLAEIRTEDVRLHTLYAAAAQSSWAEFALILSTCKDWDSLSYNSLEEEDLKCYWDEMVEKFNIIWNGGHA